MKIGIIGAGAMGSLLAFYLSERAEVWLLDRWTEQVEAINAGGLRCELDGVEALRHPHAASDPAAIGPCDAVLVLVKAHQTLWAAEQARALTKNQEPRTKNQPQEIDSQFSPAQSEVEAVLGPPRLIETRNQQPTTKNQPQEASSRFSVLGSEEGSRFSVLGSEEGSPALVVTLQNGVGNRELLADALGAERVGQGVTALGATMLGPGRVRQAGQGQTIFGASPDRAGMAALAALFNACGLPAGMSEDLDTLVWSKLIVNVGINALTALLRIPNGALVTTPDAHALVEQVVAEAVAVAAARGTPLPYDDPLAHVLAVARTTSANHSSMLQDVLRGSPTEIATINGAIVREGQRLGIPTPTNALLVELVRAIDATAGVRVRD